MAGPDLSKISVDDIPPPEELDLKTVSVDDIPPPESGPNYIQKGSEWLYEHVHKPFIEPAVEAVQNIAAKAFDPEFSPVGQSLASIGFENPKATADAAFSATKAGVQKAFDAFSYPFDVLDRSAGTAIGGASDLILGTDILNKARARDIEEGLNVVEDTTGTHRESRFLPVSLQADLVQKPVQESMLKVGADLRKSESPAVRFAGETIEGLSGIGGMASGLYASFLLNPLSLVKAGQLTKAGVALEKEGQLSAGLARQLANKERDLLTLRAHVPLAGEIQYSPKFLNPLGRAAVEKLTEASINLEMTKPGQWLRKYTTLPGFTRIGQKGEELVLEHRAAEGGAQMFQQATYDKAKSMGLDFTSPQERKAFYDYLDTPSKAGVQARPEYANLKEWMDFNLKNSVEKARAHGININSFEPRMGDVVEKSQGLFSESYVPRGTTPDRAQKMFWARLAKEENESLETLADLGIVPKGAARSTGTKGFLFEREKLSRNSMNKMIEEKYGIPEYFHDDPVLGYAQKIRDVEKAVADKRYIDQVMRSFPESEAGYAREIRNARDRIALSQKLKEPPHPDDLRIAAIRMDTLSPLAPDAAKRIKYLTGEDLSHMKLPSAVADFTNGLFVTPEAKGVQAAMQSYNRVWKNYVFFNPGFFLRNQWENFGRAMSQDVSTGDLSKATAAILSGKGKGNGYLKEFDLLSSGPSITTDVVKGRNALEDLSAVKTLSVPASVYENKNPLRRALQGLQQMSASGTIDSFLSTTKKAADSFTDNPLFRMANSVNERGEKVFRLAYYSKLRDAGYAEKAAMIKTNRLFLNYELTRNSVKQASAVIPFVNYAVKNTESLFKILAQNPRNFGMVGPGGALEKAISNWSGWDPDQPQKFKQLFGDYYQDQILGPILPGADKVEQEKDWVKKALFKWVGEPGNEGYQTWFRLPSNYHALYMMNPLRVSEMAGPMVKMAAAGMGYNWFTGQPIKGSQGNDGLAVTERVRAILNEAKSGIIPNRLIDASRAALEKIYPEAEKDFVNLGFDEPTARLFFGDKRNKYYEEAMKKAYSTMKLLYMGQATKNDVDVFFRINADGKQVREQVKAMIDQAVKNKQSIPEAKERVRGLLMRYAARAKNLMEIKQEYDKRVMKAGGTVDVDTKLDENAFGDAPKVELEPIESESEFQKSHNGAILNGVTVDDIPPPDVGH